MKPEGSLPHSQALCYLTYFRTFNIKFVDTFTFHLNIRFHIKPTPKTSLVLHSKPEWSTSVLPTARPRLVPGPGINYTGPREVLLEFVILVF